MNAVQNNWHNFVMVFLISFAAMLAALIAADPNALGVSPVVIAWLGIINVAVVTAANQLRAMGSDPTK